MIRMTPLSILISVLVASLTQGQYIVPELPPVDLSGPAVDYQNVLSQAGTFPTLETLVASPGLDTDEDGVTDLQEFLTGGNPAVADTDALGRMEKFNLALALVTNWSGFDLITRMIELGIDPGGLILQSGQQYLPGLSPTLETQFHKELADLAKDLEYDPVKIYEWVYANIEFEDYALSRKGALATYRTLRGNEWDQCSLLIALLRMSGVPARYVMGQTYESLQGNPDTEKDVALVQAWLSASHYPLPGDKKLDSRNRTWVTLAPWHKDTRVTDGIDLFPVNGDGSVTIPADLDIRSGLLTAQWEFENDLTDLQGVHNGSATGTLTYTSGAQALGQAVHFDGNSRVTIPVHDRINNTTFTKRTISLWFKDDVKSTVTGKQEVLFRIGTSGAGINIYLENGSLYVGSFNQIDEAGIPVNPGHWVVQNYPENQWNHVVLVLDATNQPVSQNNHLRAYLNGSFIGSAEATRIVKDPGTGGGTNAFLSTIGGSSTFTRVLNPNTGLGVQSPSPSLLYFEGDIDNIRIYDGALTEDQISVVFLNHDVVESRDYLAPAYDPNDTDDFDDHTQKTSIEFLEDRVQALVSGDFPGAGIKDVPRHETILSTPTGLMPATLPHTLANRVTPVASADTYISDTAETASPTDPLSDRREWVDIAVGATQTDPSSFPWDDENSLIGHWRMDVQVDPNGGLLVNDAPNSIIVDNVNQGSWKADLAPNSGVQLGGGKIGGALSFNGSPDNVRLAPSTVQDPNLNGHVGFNEYTVALWIKPDSAIAQTDGNYVVFDEGEFGNGIAIRLVSSNPNSPFFDNLKLEAIVRAAGTTNQVLLSHQLTNPTGWNHIAVTFTGNTNGAVNPNGQFRLYVNGNLVVKNDTHLLAGVPDHTDSAGLGKQFNQSAFGMTGTEWDYYMGLMDDVRIYHTKLGTPKINAIYNAPTQVGAAPPVYVGNTRLYLPQVAGRRLMLNSNEDPNATVPSEFPILELDGQVLTDNTLNSVESGEGSPDRMEMTFDPRTDGSFTRPPIRPGALANITLDALSASAGRVNELKSELREMSPDVVDDTDHQAREAFLGRMAALQSETFNLRYHAALSRLDELANVKRLHHLQEPASSTSTNKTSNFNVVWTYPEEAGSLVPGLRSDASAFSVMAAWRNDVVSGLGDVYKPDDSTNLFGFDTQFGRYLTTVARTTHSYNESLVFTDWQGTPALSTVSGFFEAIRSTPAVDIVEFRPGITAAEIRTALADSGLSSSKIDEIVNEVTVMNKTVRMPAGNVQYRDAAGTPFVESDVLIAESDQSISFKFGNFNGSEAASFTDSLIRTAKAAFTNIKDSVGTAITDSTAQIKNFASASVRQTVDFVDNTLIGNFSLSAKNLPNRSPGDSVDGDPVDLVSGEFFLEEPADISVRSRGAILGVTRRYSSTALYNGPFGYGWGWSHAESLIQVIDKDNPGLTHILYSDNQRRSHRFEDNGTPTYTPPPGSRFDLIREVDVGGALTGFQAKYTDGRVFFFDKDGLVIKKSDALGNSLTFGYDVDINLTTIKDSLNRALTLTYNDNGKVVQATDFTGRSIRYGYDGDDLIWFEDLEGNVYRYEYLKDQDFVLRNHNLTKQILPNGDFLEVFYYKNDTVSHHTNSKGDTFHFQYSWFNRYAETWNEAGFYRKLFWNKNGDVIRVNTRDGTIEQSEYDDNHNLIAHTDGNGNRTVFQYDADRNLVSVTNAEWETQAFEYDKHATTGIVRRSRTYTQISGVVDDGGETYHIDVVATDSAYDDAAHPSLVTGITAGAGTYELTTDSGGVPLITGGAFTVSMVLGPADTHVTDFTYDAHGNLLTITEQVTDPAGVAEPDQVTAHIYDVNGLNRVRTQGPRGKYTNFFYDDLGRVITVSVPVTIPIDGANELTTQVEYNAYGQPTRTVDAAGGVTVNEYDENRRLVKTTNAEGAVSTVTYGIPFYGRNFERVTAETDPLGYITRHEYDAVGDRIATTDANGNTTRFKYDELNRLIESTNALGNTTRNRYDGAGNLIETADAKGNIVRFSYDKANRLVRRREMWREQRAVEFDYDERGNLEVELRGYYGVNNISDNPNLQGPIVTTHNYDLRNRRISTVRNDGTANVFDERTTTFIYDSLGRLRAQHEEGASQLDGNGVPIASGILRKSAFSYDKGGNLTDQKVFEGDQVAGDWLVEGTPTSHVQHIYDDRGLRTSTHIKDIPNNPTISYRTTSFTYDAVGRQKTAIVDVGAAANAPVIPRVTENEYDAVGNVVRTRTLVGVNGDEVGRNEFTYNARNELVTSTNALRQTQSFTYDANGNQTTATDEEGFTARVFYDALNRQVSVQDALGEITTFEYDDLGNLTATTTPLGERTTSEYNENNELVKQFSPLINHGITPEGGILPVEFVYDEYGRLIRTFDARLDGATGFMQSETAYNNFDEVVSVIRMVTPLDEPSQVTITSITGYGGLGRVLLAKDALGNKTTSEYDVLGRVVKLTQADDGAAGSTGDETISEFFYDPAGNRVMEVRASDEDLLTDGVDETTTTFLYDELNRLIETTVVDPDPTPNNLVSTVAYDDLNRTVTATDPFGVTQATVSDEAGRRVSQFLGGGLTPISTWEYDRRGLVTRADTPEDAPTVFIYNPNGQLLKQIEAPGSAVEAVTSFEYDADGRQTRVTDPLGYVTVTDYDVAGRVVRTIEALGTADEVITKFNYDANGNLLSVIDANHIDDPDRIEININELAAEAVRYEYDELGRRTHEYDAGSGVSPAAINGRPNQTFKYDANGNTIETTLRGGRVIARIFDALDRVAEVRDVSDTGPILQSFTYDKQSRLKTAGDTNLDAPAPVTQTVGYAYGFAGRTIEEAGFDGSDRLTAQHAHAIETIYTRINAGSVSLDTTKNYLADAKPAVPTVSRAFTYEQDMRGLLGAVRSGGAGGTTESGYVYDANARLTTQTFDAITSLTLELRLGYDARGRETSRDYNLNNVAGLTAFSQGTAYDRASNVTDESINDRMGQNAHGYTYDAQHRLVGDDDGGASPISWTHDGVGNWKTTNQNDPPQAAVNLTVNEDNEYEVVAGKTHTYDARGNLTQIGDLGTPVDDDQRFTYDWSNRLVRAEVYAAGVWSVQGEYAYDALNRRVSKRVNPTSPGVGGTLTLFAYDGSRVAFELDSDTGSASAAALTRSYAYNSYIDSPVMMVDEDGSAPAPGSAPGTKYYYLQDRRFSVVALIDASGNPSERYRYEAFGKWTVHRSASGWMSPTDNVSLFENPYGFTGRRYDAETAVGSSGPTTPPTVAGLWHYRNRMYSATLGRFLQRDPAGYIDGFNLYAYVRNNPLIFVDALGLGSRRASQFNSVGQVFSNLSGSLSNTPSVERLISRINTPVTSYGISRSQMIDHVNIVKSGTTTEKALRLVQLDSRGGIRGFDGEAIIRGGNLAQEAAIILATDFELFQIQIDSLRQQINSNREFIGGFITTRRDNRSGQPITEFTRLATPSVREKIDLLNRNIDSIISTQIPLLRQQQGQIRQLFSDVGLDRARIIFEDSDTGFVNIQVDGQGFGAARRVARHKLFGTGFKTARGNQGVNSTGDGVNAVALLLTAGSLPAATATLRAGSSGRGLSAAERLAINRANGQAAERLTLSKFPGAQTQVPLRTTGGTRVIDTLTFEGLAIETKVGRVSLTKGVRGTRRQLARDVKLLRDSDSLVKSLRMDFFRSPITGKMGPTGPLREKLQKLGIEIVEHP